MANMAKNTKRRTQKICNACGAENRLTRLSASLAKGANSLPRGYWPNATSTAKSVFGLQFLTRNLAFLIRA